MAAFGISRSPLPRVQLLGPVRAWLGDDEVKLGSGGCRAVFSALALRVNETVSKAELIDGLWGERPPATAVGILHIYIHDLRKALEPQRGKGTDATVLVTIQNSYSLRLPEEQLDERRFAALHEQAQRHWATGRLPAAVDALDAALALWHGEPLHDVPGPYAGMQRARLEESRITAVERRSALLLIRGDHEKAVPALTELVAAAPSRETTRGLLMVALNQSGRRAEAVKLYQETERTLLDEQGIEPGPALRRIHQAILAGQPITPDAVTAGVWTPRPDIITLSADARPAPPPVLVGRDGDLAWLRSRLRRLLNGHGDCAAIDGVQGVGKTALVAAAFAEPDDSYTVAWVSLSGQPDPAEQVGQFCATRPLVFVVDDLHALDDDGLLVWERLHRLTKHLPLLLIGVFQALPARPRPIRLWETFGATGSRFRTIRPLTSRDVDELVERRFNAPCGPGLRELLAVAGGNPSFVNQLLDTVTVARALRLVAGAADLDSRHRAGLDAELARLARRRLGLLTAETQDVLRSAALLGERFDLGDLAVLMRASPTDLVAGVAEAVAAGMLDADGQRLAFRNAVLPTVLVEELRPELRAALRREAAEVLAAAGVPAERVAAQLLDVAPVDAWTVRWVLDNTAAVATRNPVTAFELLDHVIAGTSGDEERHDALAVHRVRLAFRLGRKPRTEAETVLNATSNPEYAAEMRWIVGFLDYMSGAAGKAGDNLRAAAADSTVPAVWRARYEALRAQFERGPDELAAAELATSIVLRHAMSTANPTATMEAYKELWFLATARRDHQAALGYAERALEFVQRSTDLVHSQLGLLDSRVISLQNLDRLDDATHTLARMRYIGDRLQPSAGRPHILTAVHYYWLGRWDDALAHLGFAGPEHGGQVHRLSAQSPLFRHGVAALIAARRADVAQLRAHLRAVESDPLVTGIDPDSCDFLVMARAVETGFRLGADAELAALDPILHSKYDLTMARHQWLPGIVRRALEAGDQDRVTAAMRVSESEAAKEVVPARAHAALRWCQGLLDRDPDALLDVGWRLREAGRSVESAAALVDAAMAFAEQDRITLAKLTFAEALPVLTELGAAVDVDRAMTLMRALGVDSVPANRPVPPGWASLSDVERSTVRLFAEQRSYPEIAAELEVSRRDVQAHLFGAMRKLGVESRADLVASLRDAFS
ncbi:BTAD domain-containing putative transcriptional regulator [Kibdelosporangium phytohabitans]|uniref:OmpR/PhoB-type domain-containing protein n=1 Tax=Kibdelosporangium phytohabitans TaxID=860235 RepID=A0A0N9HYT5_9PSEU|nr:BTAD domain-containing putative transcriptional regulator [Kibdelosporangium phytohabitans]ALG08437.1 hypothetical protein AOZ06_17305 [Kibdelosporangium phytohabitans]MBE1470511.1 DNA-binding SARP family transcriptional activator/DNA-binding CsgD family transcriptional regulator [Kibdelosporangium phytohabitans]